MQIIYRDEVSEHIRRHGGKLEPDYNAGDDCEVCLVDRYGYVIGKVSTLDRTPKPPPCQRSLADMPF